MSGRFADVFGDADESVPLRRLVKRLREKAGMVEYPMLSLSAYTGLHEKHYESEEDKRSLEDCAAYLVVHPGDVVFNPMWAFRGAVASSRLDYSGIVSPAYYVLRPGPDVEHRFLAYCLWSAPMRDLYAACARGPTTYDRSVRWEDLGGFHIPVPPLAKQTEIADNLDSIGRALSDLEDLKSLLSRYQAEAVASEITASAMGSSRAPK